MANGTGIECPGGDNLVRTLDRAGDMMQDMESASSEAGDIIAGAAAGKAPVVSGYLRSTISASVSGNTVTVGSNAVYAGPIHWGWSARNIRANPFLTDAMSENEGRVTAAYVAEVDRIVDTVEGD
jgi:HK97 gp10 family phage protein